MKKIITCILSVALLFCCSLDMNAQKKKSRSSHRTTTAAAQQPVGEPVREIIDMNNQVVNDIKTALNNYGPEVVSQIYQTRAYIGPATEIASKHSDYKLTAADKRALYSSFDKVVDAMKPGLIKAGNSSARVTKNLSDLKNVLHQQINKMTYLQGFYM